MTNSQNFVLIEDIKDDLIFLKDGSVSLILTTSAVNFDLLFETEQMSIIETFAGLLNSLSFPIQIVIRSKRLDISSYLKTLENAAARQTNPLLKTLTSHYQRFVSTIIKENDVLDKQFYVCLNVSALEIGVIPRNIQDKTKKALTILIPRHDHLIRQFGRLGLKARQLNTVELIQLFYDIYNPSDYEVSFEPEAFGNLKTTPKVTIPLNTSAPPPPHPVQKIPPLPPLSRITPTPPIPQPQLPPIPPMTRMIAQNQQLITNLAPPFVVEELADDFGP